MVQYFSQVIFFYPERLIQQRNLQKKVFKQCKFTLVRVCNKPHFFSTVFFSLLYRLSVNYFWSSHHASEANSDGSVSLYSWEGEGMWSKVEGKGQHCMYCVVLCWLVFPIWWCISHSMVQPFTYNKSQLNFDWLIDQLVNQSVHWWSG